MIYGRIFRGVIPEISAFEAHGRARAHDIIQREYTHNFFRHCPIRLPLRTKSKYTSREKSICANMLLESRSHMRSAVYDEAWYNASLGTKTKACATAVSMHSTIIAAHLDLIVQLTSLWIKTEDEVVKSFVQIPIRAYAFIVKKVGWYRNRAFPNVTNTSVF